jgi:hypothetical protein
VAEEALVIDQAVTVAFPGVEQRQAALVTPPVSRSILRLSSTAGPSGPAVSVQDRRQLGDHHLKPEEHWLH